MDRFLVDLSSSLEQVIEWSDEFQHGKRDYKFDIDNILYVLSEEHGTSFKEGSLALMYNLVDYFCDAIKHDFKSIDKNYSVTEARKDISKIIDHIQKNETSNLPKSLNQKLSGIFNKY